MTTLTRAPRALAPALALSIAASAPAVAGSTIPGTRCPAFPADSIWHADVSKLPRHARSAAWMANMSPGSRLHPDFGPSFGELAGPYGIPVTVVSGKHAKVRVSFDYAGESDRTRYPLSSRTKIEGWQLDWGDRHAVIVDKDTCRLYELYGTTRSGDGWHAGSGAVWNLRSNALRKKGWTSADAAGLPILPGLLRLDEVRRGSIDHAIRFTTPRTDRSYVWPARHEAGATRDRNLPPMGARFRLKASYPIASSLRADTKAVLRAMKRYGLILADNGSPWHFQGTAESGWPIGLLDELKRIPASAFEAVDTSSLKLSDHSGKARKR